MPTTKQCLPFVALGLCGSLIGASADEISAGPFYQEFRLTLEVGERTEAISPLFSFEEKGSQRQWAVPPLFSYTRDDATEASEFDFLYPLVTYDRYGSEYRFQLLQLLSFTGGQNPVDGKCFILER